MKDEIELHDEKIIQEFQDSYASAVESGKKRASESNVAIVSIARNSAKNLVNNIPVLEQIETYFNKCYFYFYENDSTDNTPELLESWSNTKSNVEFVTEKLDTPYLPLSTSNVRTENLARARNKCLEYVRTIQDKVDYVIVIDTDFTKFSINGLMNSFGWFDIDHVSAIAGFSFLLKNVIFPNGTRSNHEMLTNYDSWAYRHTWWSDTQQVGLMYWFQYWIPLVGSPLIKVNSAFGGCCIYKTKYYLQGKYSGENCEHVMFHQRLHAASKDFDLHVNPSMIMYVEV